MLLLFQAACPNGKISKSDTMNFLRSINSGKEEQIQKLATDIHKAFDTNNDGIVGKCIGLFNLVYRKRNKMIINTSNRST